VYNAVLFVVMGLLIGAAPSPSDDPAQKLQQWLRAGILALAGLTILISLYALSATIYRTAVGGITMNRLTVVGWNVLNIGVLALVVYRQVRVRRPAWLEGLQSAFSAGTIGYIVWTLFLVLAIPLLF